MKEESILVGGAVMFPWQAPRRGRVFVIGLVSLILVAVAGIGVVVSQAAMHRLSPSVPLGKAQPAPAPPTNQSSLDDLTITSPPLDTLVGTASAGDIRAQEILGLALLDAAERPDLAVLIPDSLYWLERAHDGGSLRAVEGLLRLFSRHCNDTRIRDQAVCQPGE